MRKLALLLVLLPAFVLAQEAAPPAPPPAKKPPAKDQVYKWVDKDGVVHYGNQPPTKDATPAKLPPLQTYKEGTSPNLNKFSKPGAGGAAAPGGAVTIELVAPTPEETFRSGERVVPVAVMVTPQVGPGQKLVYNLDGEAASPPTTDTSFVLTEVERGSHTVSVTLVGAAGEEIASSDSVTFYVHPPTVDRGGQQSPQQPSKPKPNPNKPKPPK